MGSTPGTGARDIGGCAARRGRPGTTRASNPFFTRRTRSSPEGRGRQMTEKPKSEIDDERPSEDDLAQARLGGPRGAPELAPAKMTPQRKKKTPGDFDPGHTA